MTKRFEIVYLPQLGFYSIWDNIKKTEFGRAETYDDAVKACEKLEIFSDIVNEK